jgi:P-type E1-E2 ATPase
MTFGIIFALEKLKDKGIFCISPNKIIIGGKVKHACFDKTGTLTEDFMDFYGLVPAYSKKFNPFIEQVEASETSSKPKIE